MADYEPRTKFGDLQAQRPSDPLPGAALDTELGAIQNAIGDLTVSLAQVRRADGVVANETVHPEALTQATRTLVAAHWPVKGAWTVDTVYDVNDVVQALGATFVCIVSHKALDFDEQRTAGFWLQISPVGDEQAFLDAAQTLVNEAEAAAAASELAATNLETLFNISGSGNVTWDGEKFNVNEISPVVATLLASVNEAEGRSSLAAAAAVHAHAIGDVTGLTLALDGKSAVSHEHDADYAAIDHAHAAEYAAATHTHAAADITGLADDYKYVSLATEEGTTSNSFATVPGFSWDVEVDTLYEIRALIVVKTNDAAHGVRLQISGTFGARLLAVKITGEDGSGAVTADQRAKDTPFVLATMPTGNTAIVEINGVVNVSSAGTLTLQFANNNATEYLAFDVASFMNVKELGV